MTGSPIHPTPREGVYGPTRYGSGSDIELPEVTESQLRALYRRVIETSATRRWAHGKREGYRLAWARPGAALSLLDLERSSRTFAVIGQHDNCDVQLRSGRELSCRHLIARPTRLADGSLAMRLLDLRGSIPFFLLDDEPYRSVVASGALSLRLGGHAIFALPMQAGIAPPRELTAPAVRIEHQPPNSDMRAGQSTFITILPAASSALDLVRPSARGGIVPLGPGDACLSVTRRGSTASIHIDAAELDRGVLVGRLPRCVDGGIPSILSAQVSRVHLVLIREGKRVFVLDTATTNGTFLGKTRVRARPLDDTGTQLTLAEGHGAVQVRFERNLECPPAVSADS